MAVLAQPNTLGASLGDTWNNRPVVFIHADGQYDFGKPIAIGVTATAVEFTSTPELSATNSQAAFEEIASEYVRKDEHPEDVENW